MKSLKKSSFLILLSIFITFVGHIPETFSSDIHNRIVFLHYWTGDMSGGINEMVTGFNRIHPEMAVKASGFEHETFKAGIRVMLETGNPPDFFSYWAGARTMDFVNANYLLPMDDIWEKARLKSVFSPAVMEKCTYNGKIYAMPVTQHFVAFFYNRAIFRKFGIQPPETWHEFTDLCAILKKKGITPVSLGSREKWPAQFWFDYILLRTAGPEYRQKLMDGRASYNDPQVIETFSRWNDLVKKDYFNRSPDLLDWADASKMVHNGEAAMTLMGTWIIGQFEAKLNWKQEKDFDFFSFPVMSPGIPEISLGPIDCILLPGTCRSDSAKTAIEYLAGVEPQKAMSRGSGALAPNVNIPESFYSPMKARIRNTINRSGSWAFNYDLATPPDVAESGLECFAMFLKTPDRYREILAETETRTRSCFQKYQKKRNNP